METELVSETFVFDLALTWLKAGENFYSVAKTVYLILYCHKTYKPLLLSESEKEHKILFE
jgi:hypothetical protein